MNKRVVLRRLAGRVLVAIIGAVLVGVLVYDAVSFTSRFTWREPAIPVLLFVITWLLWAAPMATLTPEGIRVVNTWRISDVPWSAVRGTRTHFGLVIVTDERQVPVSACPARSGLAISVGPRHEQPALTHYDGDSLRLSLHANDAAAIVNDYRESVAASLPHSQSIPEAVTSRINWLSLALALGASVYLVAAILL
ncbi:MAG: hypothetical protein E7A62_04155 [Actinomycetaceae bacterium]|nr:hypothetical protein [Actinomycetaceae bacterium]MDU0970178.1 hypothetical protein [Actinomycetaceae bacterium]